MVPKREPAAEGLYKSVSTTENSGLTRKPGEMGRSAWLNGPQKRSYCVTELKVMWLL